MACVCCKWSIFVTIVLLADGSVRIHVFAVCTNDVFRRIYSLQTWVFELQTVSLWWLFGRCFDQSHIIIWKWSMKLFAKHRLTREKKSNGYVGQNDGASETEKLRICCLHTYQTNEHFVRAIWHTHMCAQYVHALCGLVLAVAISHSYQSQRTLPSNI